MNLRAGALVFWVVTDHPRHPKVLYEDGSANSAWRDRETAQRIADAWNSYGPEWEWYVREVTVLPRTQTAEEQGQMKLFDGWVA